MKDLIVVTADKRQQDLFEHLLSLPMARLGTRNFSFTVIRMSGHDSDCRRKGASLINLYREAYSHALLVFDYEGCGDEHGKSADEIESELDYKLGQDWNDKAAAIVIVPELERWIWIDSPKFNEAVKWKDDFGGLREWTTAFFPFDNDGKPERPKEAFHAVLKKTRLPKSSATYKRIVETASLKKCTDNAFQKLLSRLRTWFPVSTPTKEYIS